MKKVLLILGIVLIVLISGCAKKPADAGAAPNVTTGVVPGTGSPAGGAAAPGNATGSAPAGPGTPAAASEPQTSAPPAPPPVPIVNDSGNTTPAITPEPPTGVPPVENETKGLSALPITQEELDDLKAGIEGLEAEDLGGLD